MSDKIRVNGNVLSWGSIVLKLDGDRFYGFNSITFAHKRERVKLYGMGSHQAPRGRSRGKYSTDPVKLGGPPSSFEIFRQALADRSDDGISYGDVEFQITVEAVELDETPLLVRVDRCVITGESNNYEESGDPLKEEVEIDCMKIIKNGKTLFDSSSGQVP